MKDDLLPNEDHISRYCKGTSLNEDGTVSGGSFKLRDGETYLSVNWLEFLKRASRDEEIAEIRRILKTKINPGGTAKIAVLNVGEICAHVAEETVGIEVRHRPDEPDNITDPSHSGIFDTFQDEDLIVELIAEKVQANYPAKG